MRLGRWKLFAGGFAALVVLMGMAPSVRAQGTVSGRVTAVGTNEPLSGSRVMLVGTSLVTTTGADGSKGAYLCAYDKMTGKEVGKVWMTKRVTGSPMTYQLDGKQYVVVPTTNPGEPGELVAYRLPG